MKTIQLRRLVTAIGAALTVLFVAACGSAGASYLKEGEQAPEFNLPTAQGNQVALSDYVDDQPVLLYFHMALG